MLPLIVDLGFGYRAYGYTLLFAVVLLAVVMVGTIGRPRLLASSAVVPADRCVLRSRAVGRVHRTTSCSGGRSLAVRSRTTHCCRRRGSWSSRSSSDLVVCWFLVGQYDLYLPGPRARFSEMDAYALKRRIRREWRSDASVPFRNLLGAVRRVVRRRTPGWWCALAGGTRRGRRRRRRRTGPRPGRRQPACRAHRAARDRPRRNARWW